MIQGSGKLVTIGVRDHSRNRLLKPPNSSQLSSLLQSLVLLSENNQKILFCLNLLDKVGAKTVDELMNMVDSCPLTKLLACRNIELRLYREM